ncbi:MAG TPA: ABC transporter permease [Methylomirabilota bacterium]|jgi:NitT/TauT family transport system permease protein|nr:ABC transporter permease [Methylomirabilota bacterium]
MNRERYAWATASLLLPLLVWEALPRLLPLPRGARLFFATPSEIAVALVGLLRGGELQQHFTVSALEFLIGLGLSVAVGLPLGVLLGRVRWLDDLFDPFVTALNATPRIVWLPLLMLWFGIGVWSKVMIVFLGAVFPLLVNTYEGVRNADPVLVNVVRSFGGSEWQVARMVVLPGALPYVVAGLRLAIGRAILGVVVGEFFGASRGLGYMIAAAASSYRADVMFAGVLVLMALSLALTFSVKAVEARLTRWRPDAAESF